jgi:hypothetical protein
VDPWTVIELKRPWHSIFSGHADVAKAAAPVARAISQLLEYRDAIATRQNRAALAKAYGLGPYEPAPMVVVGRGNSDRKLKWHSDVRGIPDVDIVAYDFLFERARKAGRSSPVERPAFVRSKSSVECAKSPRQARRSLEPTRGSFAAPERRKAVLRPLGVPSL